MAGNGRLARVSEIYECNEERIGFANIQLRTPNNCPARAKSHRGCFIEGAIDKFCSRWVYVAHSPAG
jgi:hypothetical protein